MHNPKIEFQFSNIVVKFLKTPSSNLKLPRPQKINDKDDLLFSPELAELLRKNIRINGKNMLKNEELKIDGNAFEEALFSELKNINPKSENSGTFYIKTKNSIHKALFTLWIELITGIKIENSLGISVFDLNVNYRFPISSLKSISTKNMIKAFSLATRKICEGYTLLAKNLESQAIALVLKYAVPKTTDFIRIPHPSQTKNNAQKSINTKFLQRIKPTPPERIKSTLPEKKNTIRILCDFDGTITKKDVSIAILDRFTSGNWRDLPKNVIKGNIGSKELYKTVESKISGSLDSMKKFVAEFVEIEDGFVDFVNFLPRSINLEIVSDGFSFYIEEILKKIGLNLSYYASELREHLGKFEFKFPNQSKFCNLCATCKLEIIRSDKISEKIAGAPFTIFIGNGISDRCAIEEADIIFAKSKLNDICQQKGLNFAPFHNFYDIIDILSAKPECFTIDFDGTLAWSYEGIKEAFEYALRKLNYKQFPENIQMYIGLPLEQCFKILIGSKAEEGVKFFREKYAKVFLKKTYLAPGVMETLKKLKEFGYKIAILSNKKSEFLKKLAENFKIDKYVDLIVGEGDIKIQEEIILKPDRRVVEFICSKLNVKPENIFIVGDSEIDQQTAISSSTKFIALYSDTRPPNFFLEKGKTAFFISSISGLEKIAYLYKLLNL